MSTRLIPGEPVPGSVGCIINLLVMGRFEPACLSQSAQFSDSSGFQEIPFPTMFHLSGACPT